MLEDNPYKVFVGKDGRLKPVVQKEIADIIQPILHSDQKLNDFIKKQDKRLFDLMQKINQWKIDFFSSHLVGAGKLIKKSPHFLYHFSEKKVNEVLATLRHNLPKNLISAPDADALIKCLSDYIHQLLSEQEQHGQYFAEAIQSLHENPFIIKPEKEEAQKDFNDLLSATSPQKLETRSIVMNLPQPVELKGYDPISTTDLKLDSTKNNQLGHRAVSYHSGHLLARASNQRRPSFDTLFTDKTNTQILKHTVFCTFIGKVFSLNKDSVISNSAFYGAARYSLGAPSQFFTEAAYNLLWYLTTDNGKLALQGTTDYFDPFSGWGDRLLIALLLAHHHPQLMVNYLGNDCNVDLLESYQEIVNMYGKDLKNFKAHFSMRTIEDFIKATREYEQFSTIVTPELEALLKSKDFLQAHFKKGFDLSITSPPYADIEKYSKYTPAYGEEGVFESMLKELNIFYNHHLRQNGYFVLNLSFSAEAMKKLSLNMTKVEQVLLQHNGARGLELVNRIAEPGSSAYSTKKTMHEAFLVFRMVEKIQPSIIFNNFENQPLYDVMEETKNKISNFEEESDKDEIVLLDEVVSTLSDENNLLSENELANQNMDMKTWTDKKLTFFRTDNTPAISDSQENTKTEKEVISSNQSSMFHQPGTGRKRVWGDLNQEDVNKKKDARTL